MKLIDRVIDYVVDRVQARMEHNRKAKADVSVSRNWNGEPVRVLGVDDLEGQLKDRRRLDAMRYRGRPSA